MGEDQAIGITPAALTLEVYLRPNGTVLAQLYLLPGVTEDQVDHDAPAVWSVIFPAWDGCRKISQQLHSYIASWIFANGGGHQNPPMY